MQVSLADYPGSRKNPVDKFMRAINSFKNQKYKNSELIIVSDGCIKTFDIYHKELIHDDNIKFCYINKGKFMMYEDNEKSERYYRGFPRQMGITLSDGELITYMDSDDVLAPDFTLTILYMYNTNKDKDWWINRSWYDNHLSNITDDKMIIDNNSIELDYINDKWKKVTIKDNFIVMSPWLLTHRKNCEIKWEDTSGMLSEDSHFSKRLRLKYKNGFTYDKPIYIRCHYSNIWDI